MLKILISVNLPAGWGPHQISCQNINTRLVAQGRLPRVLVVGREGVPLFSGSTLLDTKVCPVNCHCTVIVRIVGIQPAIEVDLLLRRRRRRGYEDGCGKKGGFSIRFLCFLILAKIGLATESQGIIIKNATICAVLML
jgi:hypothetical protein